MMWNCAKKVEEKWAAAEFPPGTNLILNIESE